jgi:uncharacterized protein (TIGR00299 family) protein
MRTAYLECFSGISGDMLLGALVDAGVSFDLLAETAVALNVGARLEQRRVSRGGIAGTKIDVLTPDDAPAAHEPEQEHGAHAAHFHGSDTAPAHSHPHLHEEGHEHVHPHEHGEGHRHDHGQDHSHEHGHSHDHSQQPSHSHAHRSLSAILAIIRAAPLSEAVKQRSAQAFQALGEAEAAIHQMPIEEVHFHEVGAVDTIVDIVCAAVGAEALGVNRWLCSPLNVGSGTVKCAHGILPVPAPATLALLGDAPVYAAGPPMERVTPTGAALLRMLDVRYGTLPAMRVSSSGYGAGGKDLPGLPNLVRLLVGEDGYGVEAPREPLTIIEAVIDDSNPQLIGYVSDLLLDHGASDVYRTAIQMKKGRSGVQLTVLCHPDRMPALREIIFRETTTIGLHWRFDQKMALAREFVAAETPWGPVNIKIARWPEGGIANAQPEYEDCRSIAERRNLPLKQVMQHAMQAFFALGGNAKSHSQES